MPLFRENNDVFVKHKDKGWVVGVVTAVVETAPQGKSNSSSPSTTTYNVRDEDGDELTKVPEENLAMHQGGSTADEDVQDLLFLTVLHEATLLRCLRLRYMKDIVYTNIGAIVVALNPFNFKIPHYVDGKMQDYLEEGETIRHNLPHSWAVAHNTYFEMVNERRNHTILVSGESGAGKTEACKMVMKYLGQVSMLRSSEEDKTAADKIRTRVIQSSPILEGFGNAKTVRNDNSSRFGKFVQIKFHPTGWYLNGAFTTKYLLEKSRIVTAALDERVYHAFYYLAKGRDCEKYGLGGVKDYKSTTAGKCTEIRNVDDGQDYLEVIEAMDTVGISKEEQDALWGVVAGCLVSQNIAFLNGGGDDASLVDPTTAKFVEQQARLWQVPPEALTSEYIQSVREARGESFTVKHKPSVAADMRDSLAKHMYDNLFGWLVSKINDTTDAAEEGGHWIGLLDIFGFECFTVNSFEQMCINLTNETLQNHYNNFIFTRDIAECRAEGIDVTDVQCPDNTPCLQLMNDKMGIMGILDDEASLPSGTDAGFLSKVEQNCAKNPFFERPRVQKVPSFVVRHYAGNVAYTVDGFVEKNRDNLKDAMRTLMNNSASPFVAALLPPPVLEKVGRGLTVGGFFRQQLRELMETVNATNPHWIRCIKPHPAKKPLMFDGLTTTSQLESSGVLGTVKIRKAGYPVRMQYHNFCVRFKTLVGRPPPKDAPVADLEDVVLRAMRIAKIEVGKGAQLGKTKIFMKSEAFHALDQAREDEALRNRTKLQSAARGLVAQHIRRVKLWAANARVIQEDVRDFFVRSSEVREERRRIREAILAQQKSERAAMVEVHETERSGIEAEESEAWLDVCDAIDAEIEWVVSKEQRDMDERMAFEDSESADRRSHEKEQETEHAGFHPQFIALHILCIEGFEASARHRLFPEQDAAWEDLLSVFSLMLQSGERNDLERFERRSRRVIMRCEILFFEEVTARVGFLPQYVVGLHHVVRQHGGPILAIRKHAEKLVRRIARATAARERHHQEAVLHTPAVLAASDALFSPRGVSSPRYKKTGDKVMATESWSSSQPWLSPRGVPDADQVGVTSSPMMGTLVSKPPQVRRRADPTTVTMTTTTATTSTPHKGFGLSHVGICETFRDGTDEMHFVTQRHKVCVEFRELVAKKIDIAGPLVYVRPQDIPDKATLHVARQLLASTVSGFCDKMVVKLRAMESRCLRLKVPEQNRVTGQWVPHRRCDASLLQQYPVCTDWRALQIEYERVKYALDNYRDELLAILHKCCENGARLSHGHQNIIFSDRSLLPTLEEVHAAYESLLVSFVPCTRCLYPMASKETLVSMRLLWPRVQCARLPDRCRTCNTCALSQVPGMVTSPVKKLPPSQFRLAFDD
eukprot:PhM_4_TR10174/c0_g1_i1/m.4161/K10357/MYO5; myosin V